MSAEAKVGLLVIVVALLAVGTAVYLSGALRNIGAYEITAQFADVQGLDEGSPVRLSGVTVGRVTRIRLREHKDFPGKPAAVTMTIQADTILYASDRMEVRQGALVGDKYVSILRPETVEAPRKRLVDNTVIGGGGASSAEIVLQEVRELIGSARISVDAINSMVTDVAIQEDFRTTVGNLRQATEQAVLITQRTTDVVDTVARAGQANEARLSAIMLNLVDASEAVEASTRQVEQLLVTSPIGAQMAAAGNNIRVASEDLAAVAASVRETAETTTLDDDAEAAMANLRLASENLAQVSSNIEELSSDELMAENIRSSLENIRMATESLQTASEAAEDLMTDEQVNEDLRVAIHESRLAAASGRATIEEAQAALGDVKGTMEIVRNTQKMFTQIDVRSQLEFRHISGEGLRADAAFDIRPDPDSGRYVRFGLRDIEDDPKLDLQLAQPTSAGLARVGLFNGQAGIGYELGAEDKHGIEAELYNLDTPRLDLRYRLSFEEKYRLLFGFERLFHGTDPMVGIRYQGDF
jgi:ABC-type transporter Mla subunit MlaD